MILSLQILLFSLLLPSSSTPHEEWCHTTLLDALFVSSLSLFIQSKFCPSSSLITKPWCLFTSCVLLLGWCLHNRLFSKNWKLCCKYSFQTAVFLFLLNNTSVSAILPTCPEWLHTTKITVYGLCTFQKSLQSKWRPLIDQQPSSFLYKYFIDLSVSLLPFTMEAFWIFLL